MGQFAEWLEFGVGCAGGVGDVAPGASADPDGVESGGGCGVDVVVHAVADVGGFLGGGAAGVDHGCEELR